VPEFANLSHSNLRRHTLVWIRRECCATVAAQVKDAALHGLVSAWLAADRPVVVSRQPALDAGLADTVATGLALPPALGKCRVALDLCSHDIDRCSSPLHLAEVIAHAPTAWQAALLELDRAATGINIELRVFGSFSWQSLSGLQYLTPHSDIDLLWHAHTRAQLQQGISLLSEWEQTSGVRADGEVVFGGHHAVSWREWMQSGSTGDQRVLVKRDRSAELVHAAELLELLG